MNRKLAAAALVASLFSLEEAEPVFAKLRKAGKFILKPVRIDW